ncbi:hypothetical protein [Methylosinus sp. Ce-a6]|uniref:hypothetical protein n=1 Tax=Methylosinus sp. Ce-a6 TaxID=2172005 RepID=UPI00135A12FE|nr:hypothetical protein [Methylosinus sp. Ce-a6]
MISDLQRMRRILGLAIELLIVATEIIDGDSDLEDDDATPAATDADSASPEESSDGR